MPLRTILAACIGAALLATPAHAQTTDHRVEAFRAVCENSATVGAMSAAARNRGWRSIDLTSEPHLAALASFTRQSTNNARMDAYAREIDGRRMVLFLTRQPLRYSALHGCAIYDFGATEALDPSAFAWVQSAPPVVTERGGAVFREWRQPTNLPRVFAVKLGFIGEGGMANAVGYSGVVMSLERSPPIER